MAGERVMEEMDEGEAVIVLEDDEVETIVIEEEEEEPREMGYSPPIMEIMELETRSRRARDEVENAHDAAAAAAARDDGDDDNALPSVLVELASWEDL